MEVFISWSGSRSEAIALALRDWLPRVIQSLRPWMSAADIDKGARWATEIAQRLEQCKVGLTCLTLDNLTAPWILFEAGAMAKTLEKTYVIPLLFQFGPAQLEGPLSQFQAVVIGKEDIRNMMQTLNRALGENALREDVLEQSFDMWWPELERALQHVPEAQAEQAPVRTDSELLEDLLTEMRSLARQVSTQEETTRRTTGVTVPSRSRYALNSFRNPLFRTRGDYARLEEAVRRMRGESSDSPTVSADEIQTDTDEITDP